MEQFAKFGPFAAVKNIWDELSASQRVVVITFGILGVAIILMVASAATKPRMAVLFSNLESDDAGAIVQKLTEHKIPYKLSQDGSTVEVPASKVYDIRLDMATQGLPQGGNVGFELFDKNSFGMTEFEQKVTYQRAIQGELTRTITQLAPVSDAKVLLALPNEKLFESEQEPATASVALKLKRGMPLSDEQVAGIVHLVASAVEGMKPENVTVIDSGGNVLSEGPSRGSSGGLLTSNQSKLKRQYESEIAQNLQSMLIRVVGQDKAVVRVSADLNFDQRQIKSESYEPVSTNDAGARGVLLSEDSTKEEYKGKVAPPSSVPVGPNAVGDDYSRTETSTRYEVSKKIEETVSAPGQLRRLSVAVMVDDKVEASKIPAIREAVIAAAGIDNARGDQVTVQRVGFDTVSQKAAEAEMAKAGKSELISSIAKNAGAAIVMIVFMLFVKSIIKTLKGPVPKKSKSRGKGEDAAELEAPQPVAIDYTTTGEAPVKEEIRAVPVAAEAFKDMRSDSTLPSEISQATPEELAGLVRSWMKEG